MADALEALHDAGAHFLLVRGKVPIWKRYQHNRPLLAEVRSHVDRGHGIGIIPYSVGSSALDLDHGNPDPLTAHHEPRAVVPSRRAGRYHLYFDDSSPRRNSAWTYQGAGGEVRSRNGFLVLYGNAADVLADSLGKPGRYPFPATDLFSAAGIPLDRMDRPVANGERVRIAAPYVRIMLEAVPAGGGVGIAGRNDALFYELRHWAYRQSRGASRSAWQRRVTEQASAENERFQEPMAGDEVRYVAQSVAWYAWRGHAQFDHSPETQRRRAYKRAESVQTRNSERDAAIAQDRADGFNISQLSRKYELHRKTIDDILRRVAPVIG